MKQLDEDLENDSTTDAVRDMAELRIRNLLAFEELQAFNDTATWKFKHPLIVHRSERAELVELLKTKPDEFLKRHRNVSDSIRRYVSYIKRADRIGRRTQDKEHLQRYREKDELFKSILNEKNS